MTITVDQWQIMRDITTIAKRADLSHGMNCAATLMGSKTCSCGLDDLKKAVERLG